MTVSVTGTFTGVLLLVPCGVMVTVPLYVPAASVGVTELSRLTKTELLPLLMVLEVGDTSSQLPPLEVVAEAVNAVFGPLTVRVCAPGSVPPVWYVKATLDGLTPMALMVNVTGTVTGEKPCGVIVIEPWQLPAVSPVGSATTVTAVGVVPLVPVTPLGNFSHVTLVQLVSVAVARKKMALFEVDVLVTFNVCCEAEPPACPEKVRLLLSVVT